MLSTEGVWWHAEPSQTEDREDVGDDAETAGEAVEFLPEHKRPLAAQVKALRIEAEREET